MIFLGLWGLFHTVLLDRMQVHQAEIVLKDVFGVM
jgi:hypothetical protein